MRLVVDSSALALLINPGADVPDDPATNQPVTFVRERIESLINSLGSSDTVIIPTPVLAEILVKADDAGPGIVEQIGGQARIRTRAFDERAAVEVAMMTREAIIAGDKRGGATAPWQKVKFDRQIIAIARVADATKIYADDGGLRSYAELLGIEVVSTWELPIPQVQIGLFDQPRRAISLDEPDGDT